MTWHRHTGHAKRAEITRQIGLTTLTSQAVPKRLKTGKMLGCGLSSSFGEFAASMQSPKTSLPAVQFRKRNGSGVVKHP
jgi:hypothetical protein